LFSGTPSSDDSTIAGVAPKASNCMQHKRNLVPSIVGHICNQDVRRRLTSVLENRSLSDEIYLKNSLPSSLDLEQDLHQAEGIYKDTRTAA
jgi:hypothetical protein